MFLGKAALASHTSFYSYKASGGIHGLSWWLGPQLLDPLSRVSSAAPAPAPISPVRRRAAERGRPEAPQKGDRNWFPRGGPLHLRPGGLGPQPPWVKSSPDHTWSKLRSKGQGVLSRWTHLSQVAPTHQSMSQGLAVSRSSVNVCWWI